MFNIYKFTYYFYLTVYESTSQQFVSNIGVNRTQRNS